MIAARLIAPLNIVKRALSTQEWRCNMAVSHRKFWLGTPIAIAWLALQASSLQGPARGGTPQTDKVPAVNSGGNPYRVIRDWAHIDGRAWGGSNGVAIDRDGKTVWATDRCSAGTTPGCFGSSANPIHHFDESGKEIRSFGAGMFVWSIAMAMCG
jgi:hypothetical protein